MHEHIDYNPRRPRRDAGRTCRSRRADGPVLAGVPAFPTGRTSPATGGRDTPGQDSGAQVGHGFDAASGADPDTSRRGPAVTLVIDASLVVSALVDAGDTGRWAESLVVSEPLSAPHLM